MSDQPPVNSPSAARYSRGALILLALAIIAPWVVLWTWREEQKTPPAAPPRQTEARTFRSNPGPWGDLESTRILIEPPIEFVPTRFDNLPPVRWVFPGATPASLTALFQSLPLTDPQRQELLAPNHWQQHPAGLMIEPSRELVLGLSPAARTELYTRLGADPVNVSQFRPSRFRAETAADWFEDSNLNPATIALVQRLVYQRGNALLFADHSTVLPLLESDSERSRLLKTLARKSALLVKLRVRPDSDLDALVRYWSAAGHTKDIEPLLRSLPKRPEGFTLDVAHLLTRFARARLYTYPIPQSDQDTAYRDCHWTSLNFFSTTPDDRLADPRVVAETLARDYYPVPADPVFGDVIFFMQPDGTAKHSCVYIADDIVFTKNGGDPDIPWILMQLNDLLTWYGLDGPVTLRAYRRRLQ